MLGAPAEDTLHDNLSDVSTANDTVETVSSTTKSTATTLSNRSKDAATEDDDNSGAAADAEHDTAQDDASRAPGPSASSITYPIKLE